MTRDPRRGIETPAPPRRAAPASCLLRLAVAEGFEPSVAFTTRAFEARSLGRSDTPPPERLLEGGGFQRIEHGAPAGSAGVEEVPKHRAALRRQDAPPDVNPVVQPGVADDVEQRGDRPRFAVVGAEHQSVDA